MIYIIVEENKPQKFVEEVNENIGKGFVPIGGVSVSDTDRVTYYVQALVLDENKAIKKESSSKAPDPMAIKVLKIITNDVAFDREYRIKYSYNNTLYELITDKLGSSRNINDMNIKLICLEDLMTRGIGS